MITTTHCLHKSGFCIGHKDKYVCIQTKLINPEVKVRWDIYARAVIGSRKVDYEYSCIKLYKVKSYQYNSANIKYMLFMITFTLDPYCQEQTYTLQYFVLNLKMVCMLKLWLGQGVQL